jgi:hypothetical protein
MTIQEMIDLLQKAGDKTQKIRFLVNVEPTDDDGCALRENVIASSDATYYKYNGTYWSYDQAFGQILDDNDGMTDDEVIAKIDKLSKISGVFLQI